MPKVDERPPVWIGHMFLAATDVGLALQSGRLREGVHTSAHSHKRTCTDPAQGKKEPPGHYSPGV
jgi:hypothetical protein